MQLMTQGEVLEFHHRPAAQSAGDNRNNRTHCVMHAGDTMAANLKTLDFSARFGVFSSHRLLRAVQPGQCLAG
jgi:hypothetical protein